MTQGLPATPLQQQIFEFQRRFPRSSAYNICYLYKLSGALDLPKFQETVQSIIDSNPVFSSVFVHSGTQVFQTRSANRVQVGVLPAAEMDEAQLVDLLRARARKPMDLTTGPLADICVAVGATASFFLVNAHHAIFDISSLEVFLRQVETGYANGAAVTPLPQFDEYLARPRCTELVEPALGQLRELFAGSASFATDGVEYTTDADGEQVGRWWDDRLEMGLVTKIADRFQARSFDVLLTLYCFVLAQMTNTSRVTVGVPFANRPEEHHDTIGLFVNTLPLPVDLSKARTFGELLLGTRRNLALLRSIESVDVIGNQGRVLPDGDSAGLNCVLTYYSRYQGFQLRDVRVERVPGVVVDQMFPFSIVFEKSDPDILIHVAASPRFEGVDFGSVFTSLCVQVLGADDIALTDLRLLDDESEAALLSAVNMRSVDFSGDNTTVVDAFEVVTKANPDRVAVEFDGETVTYRQLASMTDAVAGYLIEHFPQPYVVVSEPPSHRLVALVLAIFKAGKTYVPVDDEMPDDRQSLILNSLNDYVYIGTGPRALMSASDLIARASAQVRSDGINRAQVDETAYILFTSGSTGIPKGVKVSHRSIRSLFLATREEFDFTVEDVWTLFHSYSFDFSMWEIFGALTTGGRLVVVPRQVRRLPDAFHELLCDRQVTVLAQTPSAFSNLMRVELSRAERRLGSLKYVFLGGEYVAYNSVRGWAERYGEDAPEFVGVYGVTESAVFSLIQRIVPCYDDGLGLVGRPIANSHCFVSGLTGQIVPPGFLGEIVICGPGVSEGYFKSDPSKETQFAPRNVAFDEQSFFTRDLGYVDRNHDLVFQARKDHQVKIGGHRIELGEIENAIKGFAGCADAAVIPHRFAERDVRLVGYYVPDKGLSISADELRAHLKSKIQGYMVPAFLMEIPAKPLTTNGKLDVRGLPLPEDSQDTEEAGTTPAERVRDIWRVVLNRGGISLSDNFFDVGGSSLLITKVYYKILDEFTLDAHEFGMIDLFDHSTPADIGEFLGTILDLRGDSVRR